MAAAAASEVRVASRRIVDYLNDGEELGVEEGAGAETPPCTPAAAAAGQAARSVLPRFRWPRLARLGRKGGAAKGKGKEEAEVVAEKRDVPPVAASTSGACARLRELLLKVPLFSGILQIDSSK